MYMTYAKAQKLAHENYETYTDIGKLQSKRVLLLDAIRRADSTEAQENGLLQNAFDGGFFVDATTQSSTGFVPRDMFLALNLKTSLREADKRFQQLISGK